MIVPVYGDPTLLQPLLNAVREQSYPADRFELILVDNHERPTLRPLVPDDVRVEWEPTRGSYAARNRGLGVAKGDILAFTDVDCTPEPGWLEAGVQRVRSAGGDVVVGGAVNVFAADPAHPTATELYEIALAFPQQMYVTRGHFAATANLFTTRGAFDRVGPFNAKLLSGGDFEWCQRAHAAGIPVQFEPHALVRHPARRTFRELCRKVLRVVGGQQDQGQNTLKTFLKDAGTPGRGFVFLAKTPRLRGAGQRVKAMSIAFALKYARSVVRLMFLLGVRARWR